MRSRSRQAPDFDKRGCLAVKLRLKMLTYDAVLFRGGKYVRFLKQESGNTVDKPQGGSYNPKRDYRTRLIMHCRSGHRGAVMDQGSLKLLAEINRAIIQFRGLYAAWSKEHGISYHELLVLYTIRDQGFCTQKQICDSYLLPRQTMNHVMLDLRKRGLLELSPEHCTGREKAFVLSEEGKRYAGPLLEALNRMELQTLEAVGTQNIRALVQAVLTYDEALEHAMKACE